MSNENDAWKIQAGFRFDAGLDGDAVKTTSDLYNPGYTSGDSTNRSEILSTDGVHDISDSAKITLGKYLSAVTRGAIHPTQRSTFQVSPIDAGVSIKGPLGVSVDLNASTAIESQFAATQLQLEGRTFGTFLDVVRGNDPDAANMFNMTSAGNVESATAAVGLSFSTGDVGDIAGNISPRLGQFIKGGSGGTGHDLLLRVKKSGTSQSAELGQPEIDSKKKPDNPVQRSVSSILKNNRFSQVERAFVQNHEKTTTGVYLQPALGAYTKDDAVELSEEEIATIANKILLEAAGAPKKSSSDTGSTSSTNSGNSDGRAEPRATGSPWVPVESLRSAAALPQKNSKYSKTEYVNSDASILSYGSVNTPAEPFDSTVSSDPMLKIVAISFNNAIEVANKVREFVRDQVESSGAVSAFVRRRAVDRRISDRVQSQIFTNLGIPNTDKRSRGTRGTLGDSHDWHVCFLEGLEVFFGTSLDRESPSLDIEELPLDFKNKVSTSPGYYVAVARNSMRDSKEIVEAQTNSGSDTASGDPSTNQAAVKSTVSLIAKSSTWKFIISMISLGYRSLEGPESDAGGNSRLEEIGTIHDSRDASGFIPWSHNKLASTTQYILPSTLIAATTKYGSAHSATVQVTTPGISVPRSKITQDEVKLVEDRLDGEYMPFYFHDLRTNEIIAFQAFLTDLTDGFTANYNSTTGYGRSDDVMIYNNTKRAISFGFHLVATSRSDMDSLYWNVNKLVSMVYPQYSRGRQMVSGDQKFIQPFSQIPTASPMIRVRIGDMVKSNYSKFGVARLFGLGQEDSFEVRTAAVRARAQEQRTTENPRQALEWLATQEREMIMGLDSAVEKEVIVTESVSIAHLYKNAASDYEPLDARGRVLDSLTSLHKELLMANAELIINRGSIRSVTDVPESELPSEMLPARKFVIEILEFTYTNRRGAQSTVLATDVLGDYRYYTINQQSQPVSPPPSSTDLTEARARAESDSNTGAPLQFTQPQRERIVSAKLSELNQATQREYDAAINSDVAVEEFFRSGATDNPIIRSFETTRGRGMAGFITGLNFDWAEATWEIDAGVRAPKMMKVSVSFSPIHDIPLGLDSNGAMRAVAYGVGTHSKRIGRDPYDV